MNPQAITSHGTLVLAEKLLFSIHLLASAPFDTDSSVRMEFLRSHIQSEDILPSDYDLKFSA